MKKRIVSIVLALGLAVSAMPGVVFSAENQELLTAPFLQAPGEESVNVVWFTEFESDENTVLLYENGTDKEPREISADTTKMSRMRTPDGDTRDIFRHEAKVEGLPKYFGDEDKVEYKVKSDSAESDVYKLQAMAQPGVDMKILLTSDSQLKNMSPANMQKVVEKYGEGEIDAIFFAGDLVNVPDLANEWFDDANGGAFFPSMQGFANKTYPESKGTYTGGAIIQYAPMFTAIGNHEVMGRYLGNKPETEFNDPATRAYAQAVYNERNSDNDSSNDIPEAEKEEFIANNSFNTTSYEELFTLPVNDKNSERYYSVTVGDVRLVVLEVTRIWRHNLVGVASKYSENIGETGETNPNRLWGTHIFESIKEGSDQYVWLQNELESDEFKNARYKVVMFHHQFHSLGGNVVPAYTDPVEKTVKTADGRDLILYEYPLENDQMVGIEPLLEDAGVDLILNGHSHIWNRFVNEKGINVLETSNVGNTYEAFYDTKSRVNSVPSAFKEDNEFHYLAGEWDSEDYVLQGDPYGLTPVMPTIAPLNNKPYIESNTVTAFSVLDTATGIIDSYYYDTENPDSEIVHFDSFSAFNQSKKEQDTPVWENPFADVTEKNWFYESVKYASEKGILKGSSETEFSPNASMTRAMIVTALYRLEGMPEADVAGITFDDIASGKYYEKAVAWAENNGIVKGITETEFKPNDNISREQMAAIMQRYATFKGYDVSVGENTNVLSYEDAFEISEYAMAGIQYAVGSGLLKGKSESTINPKDSVTRAETAAIIERFCKL